MPEARPKIEREKIRKRRPNDLLFDEGGATAARHTHLIDDDNQGAYIDGPQFQGDTQYENAEEDWTIEEGEGQVAVAWDHDTEDDWVLEGDDSGHGEDVVEAEEDVYDDFEEESGVVWEDSAFPAGHTDDSPDELSFGSQSDNVSPAPEVELAGRRDVRPKAPRPIPEPRTRAPGQRQRRQQPPQGRPQVRQPQPGLNDSNEPIASQHGFSKPAFNTRQRPTGPTHADGARFSRTRATLGGTTAAVAVEPDGEVLEQPRSGPPQRRRQAQPLPAPPRASRRKTIRRKGHSRGLIAIIVLVLLAGGGWLTYQAIGPQGVGSMVDRLSTLIPLPGSSRTAADTSFGDQDASGTGVVSPEQALSDLEQRVRQQDDGQTSPAAGADGPPIPQFKPLPGATRSLSLETPAGATDEARIAANEGAASNDEQTNGLSIFQQLWRYLSPG